MSLLSLSYPASKLPPHMARVQVEYRTLLENIGKLGDFLGGELATSCSERERSLMRQQFTQMQQLATTLDERPQLYISGLQ